MKEKRTIIDQNAPSPPHVDQNASLPPNENSFGREGILVQMLEGILVNDPKKYNNRYKSAPEENTWKLYNIILIRL